jgi:hypothetical protein
MLLNRVIRSFTVMAPVRQKIREMGEGKLKVWSFPLVSKMRHISLEINHLCFDHCSLDFPNLHSTEAESKDVSWSVIGPFAGVDYNLTLCPLKS